MKPFDTTKDVLKMRKKPALKDWHWADVLAAIKKTRFGSLEALARHYGLKSHASLADAKAKPYAAAERRIAMAIGKRPEEIWPSRWHSDGRRKSRSEMSRPLRQKSTPIVHADNVNKSQEI